MKIIKDLIATIWANAFRFEELNEDGTSKGTYKFYKFAPGTLAQIPTPVNAALLEDMYGYSNETITIDSDGSITTVSDNVTETISINPETGVVTQTKTDGTKTITMTMTITEGETALTIAKAVS